jgi:hypothetical protein
MDLSAHTAPIDSERVKENRVAAHSEIAPETAFKADAWIPQRTLPLLTQKESRKIDSLPTQISLPKLLLEVTHGFVCPHSPCWLGKS